METEFRISIDVRILWVSQSWLILSSGSSQYTAHQLAAITEQQGFCTPVHAEVYQEGTILHLREF